MASPAAFGGAKGPSEGSCATNGNGLQASGFEQAWLAQQAPAAHVHWRIHLRIRTGSSFRSLEPSGAMWSGFAPQTATKTRQMTGAGRLCSRSLEDADKIFADFVTKACSADFCVLFLRGGTSLSIVTMLKNAGSPASRS